jgi:Fe-S-cluster containining protein
LSTSPEDPLASPFQDRPDEPRPRPVEHAAKSDAAAAETLCRSCGACCAYSREWPRFSLEDDATLALIPRAYVDDGEAAMRCNGDRCAALVGEVGVATSCAVYDVRPDVCRACEPGDGACVTARHRFGMEALART